MGNIIKMFIDGIKDVRTALGNMYIVPNVSILTFAIGIVFLIFLINIIFDLKK